MLVAVAQIRADGITDAIDNCPSVRLRNDTARRQIAELTRPKLSEARVSYGAQLQLSMARPHPFGISTGAADGIELAAIQTAHDRGYSAATAIIEGLSAGTTSRVAPVIHFYSSEFALIEAPRAGYHFIF